MANTNPSTPTQNGSVPMWRSPFVLWGAAALALLLGYADLWRGGETMSAILLTIGYLVLVPLAILKG